MEQSDTVQRLLVLFWYFVKQPTVKVSADQRQELAFNKIGHENEVFTPVCQDNSQLTFWHYEITKTVFPSLNVYIKYCAKKKNTT